MTIKFYHEKGRNSFLNALVWYCSMNKPTRREGAFIYVQVDDFFEFCGYFWRALSECSMKSDGEVMRRRYIFDCVDYEKHVRLWWDEEAKGVRYVAV